MKARVNASGDTLARIRELEAELAEEHRQNVRNLVRAEKAEARAAELEIRLASANKAIEAMLREGEEGARIRAYLETGDASLIGAREREAD